MDENRLNEALDAALGQAIAGALGQAALWSLLVSKGVVSFAEAELVIDGAILSLERLRGRLVGPDSGPGAIDRARLHLQGQLDTLRTFQK